jgi:hypothetical protein
MLIFLCLLTNLSFLQNADSTKKQESPIFENSTILSIAYTRFTNWEQQFSNICTNAKQLLKYNRKFKNFEAKNRFYGELAFTKIIDSAWMKTIDFWELDLQLIKNNNSHSRYFDLSSTFSFYISSQFLNQYKNQNYFSKNIENSKNEKVSSLFNPMQLNFSYGRTLNFKNNSKILFNISDLMLSTIPNFDSLYQPAFKNPLNEYKIKNSLVLVQYGISIQTNILHKFNDHFRWECYSRLFANGIHPQKINFDLKNLLIVNPLKHLSISFTMRQFYNPLLDMKFTVKQRYEMFIGLEF